MIAFRTVLMIAFHSVVMIAFRSVLMIASHSVVMIAFCHGTLRQEGHRLSVTEPTCHR
jgi:hypothetical protein